jgi:Bacterial SH3 domain
LSSSEPRIPIEVDKRPVFREGPRLGCSAIALTALFTALAFYFLVTQVTPKWVAGGAKVVGDIFNNASPTPDLALYSPTPEATDTPEPTPTAQESAIKASYVQVANTGGDGVRLRSNPQTNTSSVRTLPEGTVVQVIGPDQTNADGTWAYVRTLDENSDTGWISRKYLAPAPAP